MISEQQIASLQSHHFFRNSATTHHAILQALPDLIFLMDEDGNYLDYHANDKTGLYVQPEEFLGRNMRDIMPPELCDKVFRAFREAKTSDPAIVEYSLLICNETRFYESRIVPCGDRRFLSIVRDVSDRKHAERILERISDTIPCLLFVYDVVDKRCIYTNKHIVSALGYSQDEFEGLSQNLSNVLHPDDLDEVIARLESLDSMTPGNSLPVYRMRHKTGAWRWFEVRETIFRRSADGRVYQILSVATDITQRKDIQEDLQRLSAQLLSFKDAERRMIAHKLHDVTAQNIFAMTLHLEYLQHPDIHGHSDPGTILAECQVLGERSLQDVRTLSYMLHPPAVDHVGFIGTLRWYVDRFSEHNHIPILLEIDDGIERMPLEVETDLFQVVHERLSDILQQPMRGTTIIRLKQDDQDVILEMEDDLCVSTMSLLSHSDVEAGVGLGILAVRHRFRQFGGRIDVKSTGNKTLLAVRMPKSSFNIKRKSGQTLSYTNETG